MKKNALKPFLFICLALVITTFVFANPVDPPGPPQNIEFADWDSSGCAIEWKAPNSDGGAPILRFIIEMREPGRDWEQKAIVFYPDFSCWISLAYGKLYQFRVIAVTKFGAGEPSEPTDFIHIR